MRITDTRRTRFGINLYDGSSSAVIEQPGIRTKVIIVVATPLDPVRYSNEDLADLYRQRWNNELDLRSIKSETGMQCVCCNSPELVRKEIWTHVLAYNLIRTIMAHAAAKNSLLPRTISFSGALQTVGALLPIISLIGYHRTSTRTCPYQRLLDAFVLHRVPDRPKRFEPERINRRNNQNVPRTVPNQEAKRQILKGLTRN